MLRDTGVGVVPDPGVDGLFVGELSGLRVVRRPLQTRVFEVNVVAMRGASTRQVAGGGQPASLIAVSSSEDRDALGELERAVQALLSGPIWNVARGCCR
ncbi:MAG: hypothetical protein VYE68_11645 [Acidobacteriota bacterium]|nr:hypothetical protein [Acidobacteriota bacterium]